MDLKKMDRNVKMFLGKRVKGEKLNKNQLLKQFK